MSITLNLKNGSIIQYEIPGKSYSEFSHEENDKISAIDVGVKTIEDASKESFVNLVTDKIYHNGNNITPYNYITNCLTEILQDVEIEIDAAHNVTVKAGTKAYFGDNTFLTLNTDLSLDIKPEWATIQFVFALPKSGDDIIRATITHTISAATNPGMINYLWFNTTDNKCYFNFEDGSTAEVSFPIAIVSHIKDEGWVNIDEIFNGFGYIGATAFALPGIKGFIPDYRNPDRSLKSIEFTTNSVLTRTYNVKYDNYKLALNSSHLCIYTSHPVDRLEYKEKENINYNNNLGAVEHIAHVGFISCDGTRITSFKPKAVFHAVDYNEYENLNNVSRNLLSGYEFSVVQENVIANQAYSLDLPYTINCSKYKIEAVIEFKSTVGNFEVGDRVPLNSCWGANYRNISYWYNNTKVGFGSSDQISCLPRGTSNGNTNVMNYIKVIFEFYKTKD